MERIRLSSPISRFQTVTPPNCCTFDCFPLSSSKVAMADQTGRARSSVTRRRAAWCLCQTSTSPSQSPSPSLSLVLMMMTIPPVVGVSTLWRGLPTLSATALTTEPSDQFEAFMPSKPSGTSEDLWHCRLLPAPPFVHDPANLFTYPTEITSYTVLGSHICISTESNATTYCLDTKSNTWDWEVVKGMLPFYGKVQYVPELKLWFGLSNKTRNFAAADLCTMGSRPQLIGDWKEFDQPEDWLEYDDGLPPRRPSPAMVTEQAKRTHTTC